MFCGKGSDVLKENDTIVFTKLAQTFRKIAEEGAGAFYQGELGQNFVADIQADGNPFFIFFSCIVFCLFSRKYFMC